MPKQLWRSRSWVAPRSRAVGIGKAPVAFGNVGGNRNRGPVELIDKESVAPGKLRSRETDRLGEVDCLLIDDELLESECHEPGPAVQRVESG